MEENGDGNGDGRGNRSSIHCWVNFKASFLLLIDWKNHCFSLADTESILSKEIIYLRKRNHLLKTSSIQSVVVGAL